MLKDFALVTNGRKQLSQYFKDLTVLWFFDYSYLYWTMSRTREALMKINKDVLRGMVLDYKGRF